MALTRAEISNRYRTNHKKAMQAKARIYNAAHKEEQNAWRRARRISHPNFRLAEQERAKAYHLAHREEQNMKTRVRLATHRDEINMRRRALRIIHRKEINSKSRAYYYTHRNHDNTKRKANRLKEIGVVLDEVMTMFKQQNSHCVICNKPLQFSTVDRSEIRNAAHTDHNHVTRKLRGILCQTCNFVLGHAHDNPAILLHAIRYLLVNDHPNVPVDKLDAVLDEIELALKTVACDPLATPSR